MLLLLDATQLTQSKLHKAIKEIKGTQKREFHKELIKISEGKPKGEDNR